MESIKNLKSIQWKISKILLLKINRKLIWKHNVTYKDRNKIIIKQELNLLIRKIKR